MTDYGLVWDAPVYQIASKYPDEDRDFSVDVSAAIDVPVDLIESVTLSCSPSGVGEMQISALSGEANRLTYSASGGQPGRLYTLKFVASMTDGRVYAFIARQRVSVVLPEDQAQAVPTRDFGLELSWSFLPGADLGDPRNSGLITILAGF